MAIELDVAPEGWWALGDADRFFPDDLPADWRLTYFANAYPAVLLPAGAWRSRSAADLGDWRDDVHGRFRFYLETPPAAADEADRLAGAALGDALAAFVRLPDLSLLAPAEMRPIGSALRCPAELNRDLRGARAWLEAQALTPGSRHLVILDRPTAAQLEQWQQLVALLGFERPRSAARVDD